MKMKRLSVVLTAALFLSANAYACGGCTHAGGGGSPTPYSGPDTQSANPSGVNNDDPHHFRNGILVGAALTCLAVSVGVKIADGRWTWCGIDGEKSKPAKDEHPLSIAPERSDTTIFFKGE